MDIVKQIESAKTSIGIEFGSTRIKAVMIGEDFSPIASGTHDWQNRLENGIWTYTAQDITLGLQDAYKNLADNVRAKYGVEITNVASIGISAMMHGYLPFDKDGNLLAEFRTWRNTMTGDAAKALTEAFGFNIPQRWSIAHLYQAILNGEAHVPHIAFFTTLAGYVHWQLTGEKVLGIGDASGMFPIDSEKGEYDKQMLAKFSELVAALAGISQIYSPRSFPQANVQESSPKAAQNCLTRQESSNQASSYVLPRATQAPEWSQQTALPREQATFQQAHLSLQWLCLKESSQKSTRK